MNCNWCGKSGKVNQFGYCDECNAAIRNDIVKHKDILENLAAKSHSDLSQSDKDAVLIQAQNAATALEVYKERGVPFFKSNVTEMLKEVEDRLTVPKGTVIFKPLEIVGRSKKSFVLEKNCVKIICQGSLFASAREKSIPIKQIVGVEVKKPGSLVVGFIQIQTAGQMVASSSNKYSGGAADAVHDENSVLFEGIDSYHIAMKIKEYIENYGN
ncbi:MAG: hypothetical protein RR315_04190 [Oscillospiraceae bacterium]